MTTRPATSDEFKRNVQITITVSEVNGKLDIISQMPEGQDDSIAVVVAQSMVKFAREMLNEVLGQKNDIHIGKRQ